MVEEALFSESQMVSDKLSTEIQPFELCMNIDTLTDSIVFEKYYKICPSFMRFAIKYTMAKLVPNKYIKIM